MGRTTLAQSSKSKHTLSNTQHGHVCPNPTCKKKAFRTYTGLHRHIVQKAECKTYLQTHPVDNSTAQPIIHASQLCQPILSTLQHTPNTPDVVTGFPPTEEDYDNFSTMVDAADDEESANLNK